MYDLAIRNGLIVDGTRAPVRRADLWIKDGRIAGIGRFDGEAAKEIDAAGKAVAPGFLDIHSHSDGCVLVPYRPESKLCQGVTFELCGNCGISILPSTPESRAEISEYFTSDLQLPMEGVEISTHTVTDYAEQSAAAPKAGNYGLLIGHGTLRGCVMGFENRNPTPDELRQLEERLAAEMERGAFGMSLGLIYPPSAFAETWELDALARVVRKHHGILSVHMRNEGPRVFEAADEMLGVAERTGVHLEISHLKIMTKSLWGRSQDLLDKIDAARARGADVTCDQYPYYASSTSMTAMIPKWAHDGGVPALMERVMHPGKRLLDDIAAEMESRGGPDRVLVASTRGGHPAWEGRTVEQIAGELSCGPVEAVVKILQTCGAGVSCIYFSQYEEDVERILRRTDIAVGSDGYGFSYDPAITRDMPHPRNFGTFPHAIELARDKKLLPLEDIIYKMTGLPAGIMGMSERGILAEGKAADITIFDPETIRDNSTFTDPVKRPSGIGTVLVAGTVVLEIGEFTGAAPGRVLLHGRC